MTLRIVAVQATPTVGAVADNIAAAAAWTRRAGADLVVFPEAFTTGYDDAVFRGPLPRADDAAWLGPLQEAVEETGTTVVLNSALDRGDRRTLTDVVLVPGREPWPAYDKQHLHPPERAVFTAGAHATTLTIGEIGVALSVCYDANFPEHAAAAAADGAVVYVNSGAYFPGGEHRRDLHYASRALDNGIYVVLSALTGGGFIGGSAVYDPLGRPVERLGAEEGIVVAEIDPDVVAAVREDQRMWADRRSDLEHRVAVDLTTQS
ncbi:carbon-nitrogen hydrolase family protein [Nocardioides sp. CER19]|uniref:carbon-nitrogen hydrolase family protein n=1 Tax=Nocardioides sp. CER19 TaxID=3038538 RepID=UPI0024482EF8|nr:carbon-nitrogen hydrolase family protein [Nocardioides sp. CER19]MDH2413683.1 carbon-nitrogen hydrolase family protein [Nocardioides sp. CER19]